MSAREEIQVLVHRLRELESTPTSARNRSVIMIGCDAIRERLSFLSRLSGFGRVRVV